jgi:hypothetical protein
VAIKRCTGAFAAVIDGVPRVVAAGELVDAADPVVKGREHHFEDVETFMERRAGQPEATTAEPGEKRALSRPQRRGPARGKGKDDKAGEGQ